MKEVFHKVASIAMVILLLLSTISWKIEKHYCMGRLMDIALFSEADGCGMNMAGSSNDENLNEVKKSCCNNEVVLVDGQDELQLSFNDLNFEHQYFLIRYSQAYNYLLQVPEEQEVLYEQHPPPFIVKDIQLFDEQYLI